MTTRLTFTVVDFQIALDSAVSLDMVCPPTFGECPTVNRNSGCWLEVRDEQGEYLFHRTLHKPLEQEILEVLVPGNDANSEVVIFGSKTGETAAEELARFQL